MTVNICFSGLWLNPKGDFANGYVLIEDGQIKEAGTDKRQIPITYSLPEGTVILPGFIDLQINGAFGVDITENISAISTISRHLPEYGVTSFLPTIVSSSTDSYPEFLNDDILNPYPGGALPLGLHLEGPFLNPQKKGAHAVEMLASFNDDLLKQFLNPKIVKLISLAPELPGGLEAVKRIREVGIVPAAAHSTATYMEAREAFAAGLGYGTHIFNAMPPLHHREPGLVGAFLERGAPPVGIIVDGIHIHKAILSLIFRCKGVGGLTLVSDAIAAAGFGYGDFQIGQQQITVDEKGARLSDGTFAGSTILLVDAVRNMVKYEICTLAEAAQMASSTPAKVLGLDKNKGEIRNGYDADLVILDKDLGVGMTLIGGKICHNILFEQ